MSALRRVAVRAAGCLLAASPLASQSIRVVDSATSQPIDRAEVLVAGYATLRTTEAGVASLRFLKPGPYRVVVRRVGYVSQTISVDAIAEDTSVIKVVLAQVARSLPAVTTEAARDHKLEMMGFYERRKSSAAPRSAFITQQDLERWKPTFLSDVRYKTGRGIGGCVTYLDGVRIGGSPSPGNTYRRGIDALVQVSEVAAMEVYRAAEVPARFTPPRPSCVVLIWLK